MSLLSSAELASMREEFAESLDLTADIYHPTWVVNSENERELTFPDEPTYADVPCRRSPLPAGLQVELRVAEKVTSGGAWVLTFPQGTEVQPEDRITVGSEIFEVLFPMTPRSFQISARIVCIEVL